MEQAPGTLIGYARAHEFDSLGYVAKPQVSRWRAVCHGAAASFGDRVGEIWEIILVLWVPITSSTLCDQVIFVDHATDLSLFSDAAQVEVDRLG